MAERLPRASGEEVYRALLRDGWVLIRQSGTAHAVLHHPQRQRDVTVPRHRTTLKPETMSSILKQGGYTPEEFRRLP